MQFHSKSMRPFLGSKNFDLARNFYKDFGFEETVLAAGFSVFKHGAMAFYLQDDYVKDWIDNTQIFLEVEDLDHFWSQLSALDLPSRYPGVRVEPIRTLEWGRECFVHDPSGVLWHVGEFK